MRPAVLTVPVLAAAVLLASACAATPGPVSTTPATSVPSNAPSNAPASAPSNAPASGKAGGTGAGKTVAVCRTRDLGAVVTFQSDRTSGATRMAMVTLTNKTKSTCAVDGWASISLVDAADEVVPVKTTRVDQPGAPVRTVLKPGTSAFAGIKWTVCDKADASCRAGNTLRFNLEASTDGAVAQLEDFPNPATSAITMAKLQLGSLQPSHQGVVAW